MLLRAKQIVNLLSIGRSTWWAWVKEGKAPAGIRFGNRITVWRAGDIQAFIAGMAKKGAEA